MPAEPDKERVEKSSPDSAIPEESPAAEDFAPSTARAEPSQEEALQQLRAEKKQLMDQLLRKQAELENFRKRALREKEEFLQFSLLNTVKSLLPVLDGFELALESNGSGEDYRKGVEMIYRQLCGILQKMGLETMEVKGREFDPHLHEALATVETGEYPDHQILEEIQRGYFFKQRLLRPARVKVAQQPAETNPPDTDAEPE